VTYVMLPVRRIRQERRRAFQVVLDAENMRVVWIPKSQIANAEDFAGGDWNVELPVADWLVKEIENPRESAA
jgi:hypothetical protein